MPDPTPDEPRRTPLTREGITFARGSIADARRALAAARPAPGHVQAAARAADAAIAAAGGVPAVLARVCPPGRHRPDDDPTPGDRCKDCGRELTWRGPGPHDWDVAEPAPIGYLVVEPSPVPSEPPRANWDGEIHPTRERADAECAQANGAGSGPRERPDYWWRVVAVVELDALAPADADEPDDGGPFRPRWPLLVSEDTKRELLQELAEIVHTPRPDGSAGQFARGYETGVAKVMLHLGINEAGSPEGMYRDVYFQIQALLDEALGTDADDGAGEGIVADVRLALTRARQRGAVKALMEYAGHLEERPDYRDQNEAIVMREHARRIESGRVTL